MPKKYLYFFIIFNLSIVNQPLAQNAVTDTGFYLSAIHHIVELYVDSVKENLNLYNGTEFKGASRGNKGHQFFEYSEPQKGNVFYDGIFYPDMMLSYDLISDEIIFFNSIKNVHIKLNTQKISWFTIQNHMFVYIGEEANSANFPGSGFYELLYEGAVSALVKRKKQLDESSKADEASKFIQWINYYVRKDNKFYTIDSKRSLLAVCMDHKNEVAKFMQREKLNFKKDPANTIIKVIAYYTQLKN